MRASINNVHFTFTGLCGTCVQEAYDNEDSTEEYPDMIVTIISLIESGTPICPECGNDLEVQNECLITGR